MVDHYLADLKVREKIENRTLYAAYLHREKKNERERMKMLHIKLMTRQ